MSALLIDFRLSFRLGEPHEQVEVVIEGPFTLSGPDLEKRVLDPNRTESLAPALTLFNMRVDSITAQQDGALVMDFQSGMKIEVAPQELYDSWQLTSKGRFMLICGPGGVVTRY